jgi:hypothetical protein
VATTADINGGTIDATTIGATTPSTGAFTTLSARGQPATNVERSRVCGMISTICDLDHCGFGGDCGDRINTAENALRLSIAEQCLDEVWTIATTTARLQRSFRQLRVEQRGRPASTGTKHPARGGIVTFSTDGDGLNRSTSDGRTFAHHQRRQRRHRDCESGRKVGREWDSTFLRVTVSCPQVTQIPIRLPAA